MRELQIPDGAEIHFEVICNMGGVTVGCVDCRRVIYKKNFYVEATIAKKAYMLSYIEEFRCPFCNAVKMAAIAFDTEQEAFEYTRNFVGKFESKEINFIPLIEPSSGVKFSTALAKNARLN